MTNIMSTTSEAVLMRRATAGDTARIRTLALLDDKRVPAGPFLVAEVGGRIVAARSLSTGTVVADPFRLTSDIVAMLRLRAAQVGATADLAGRRALRHRSSSGARSLDSAVAA
ncbi:MAG: hypothetical protein QOH76_1071 [Thermoleophilaceae bacterium]|jgi:hypothetical protein|nr:hypothetical protein [Thermoleophilaceae bacterium]